MNKKINIYFLGMMLFTFLFIPSCSLHEDILDEYTTDVLHSDKNLLLNLLAPPVAELRNLWWRERVWGLEEATSDELFFPTRGGDWFDLGTWQADYNLNWSPTHRDVIATWNELNSGISICNTSLFNLGAATTGDSPLVKSYRAQATFLRAFYEYYLYDLYRVYPSRDPFDLDFTKNPTIFSGADAFYRLVTIVKSQLPDIVTRENAVYGQPNKDAALMLLSKLYLNKEVYTNIAGYDSCLIYLNQIIDGGNYSLANDYFNMFSVTNDQNFSKPDNEAIFVAAYDDALQLMAFEDQMVWVQPTFHYNQNLGSSYAGWNGCSAPEGYLQQTWISGSDTATDVRWKNNSTFAKMAVNLGFNYGQQYNVAGDSLRDRNGHALNFTFECPLAGAAEYQGVRVLKYPPRLVPVSIHRIANDFVIWRFADALLMKAECLARANDVAGALAVVGEIRTKRNAPPITATTQDQMLKKILIERGLELYWEGHRRQDMIRLGTFLLPKTSKTSPSDPTRIILPIPQAAIDGSGGTLHQNPGY
jgi:hypothetical protein